MTDEYMEGITLFFPSNYATLVITSIYLAKPIYLLEDIYLHEVPQFWAIILTTGVVL